MIVLKDATTTAYLEESATLYPNEPPALPYAGPNIVLGVAVNVFLLVVSAYKLAFWALVAPMRMVSSWMATEAPNPGRALRITTSGEMEQWTTTLRAMMEGRRLRCMPPLDRGRPGYMHGEIVSSSLVMMIDPY